MVINSNNFWDTCFLCIKKQVDKNIAITISIGCILLFYIHPIPLLYLTWKYSLPKETITKYIFNFGLPYDVGKDSVIWKNIGGFDTTWVLDEQIKHTHPIDHIDFVYSTGYLCSSALIFTTDRKNAYSIRCGRFKTEKTVDLSSN